MKRSPLYVRYTLINLTYIIKTQITSNITPKVEKIYIGGLVSMFRENLKSENNENFEQSSSAEKCKRGYLLGFFNIHSFAKLGEKN